MSGSDGSESASESEQNDPPSSLAADAEQYERMQASYVAVGRDFHDQEDLIGSEYSKLQRLELVPERWPLARLSFSVVRTSMQHGQTPQNRCLPFASYAEVGLDFNEQEGLLGSEYRKLQRLEMVPQRWPLAKLSFSLQKCVDHLDRVLAGCCWEVYATRTNFKDSVSSLRQVSKSLTMLLAVYLAKEVAAILRAILTHPTKKLYDDKTAHLLCSNYWVQPIFQELLHSSSRYNATRTGERNRPSSGLARISAYPRPPKRWQPSASSTRFI